MKGRYSFSLRELLLVVLFFGVGMAAMCIGGVFASVVIFLAIVVTMCFAIMAFAGRGQVRAFATGFLIPILGYAVVVAYMGKHELEPRIGKLPTSQLLRPLFETIVRKQWVDITTGEVVPNYDPKNAPGVTTGSGNLVGRIASVDRPRRGTFMAVGHILIGMLLGYAGAKFAVVVHRWPADE